MTIDLPALSKSSFADLAKKQNRDIVELVEDAVRQYLEASAITDVDPNQVAETQAELLSELPPLHVG